MILQTYGTDSNPNPAGDLSTAGPQLCRKENLSKQCFASHHSELAPYIDLPLGPT